MIDFVKVHAQLAFNEIIFNLFDQTSTLACLSLLLSAFKVTKLVVKEKREKITCEIVIPIIKAKVYSVSPQTSFVHEHEIESILNKTDSSDDTLLATLEEEFREEDEDDSKETIIFVRESTPMTEEQQELRHVGMSSLNCIFGIDFTISNLENGRLSFDGKSLHHIDPHNLNPYQKVIMKIGGQIDELGLGSIKIHSYGFGDALTRDRSVFKLSECTSNFNDILASYLDTLKLIRLSGPTNFAPLIKEAIRLVKQSQNEYHVLVIIADGQVTNARQTREAIVEASHFSLSIIMIGVGDGTWQMMSDFETNLKCKSKFENFKFFIFDDNLCKNFLSEIIKQFKQIKEVK